MEKIHVFGVTSFKSVFYLLVNLFKLVSLNHFFKLLGLFHFRFQLTLHWIFINVLKTLLGWHCHLYSIFDGRRRCPMRQSNLSLAKPESVLFPAWLPGGFWV